jgi:hypothetical protein
VADQYLEAYLRNLRCVINVAPNSKLPLAWWNGGGVEFKRRACVLFKEYFTIGILDINPLIVLR